MSKTPKRLLAVLDQLTANLLDSETVATPEALGFSANADRQLRRSRPLFDDDNVVGAGVAEKISEGEATGELAVVVYVKRKLPATELDPARLVPPVIAGPRAQAVFTDVVEVGEIAPQENIGHPPLRSGFSIGHVAISAGTLGAIVRKGGQRFCLSNAHVLARSGLAHIGDPILYPGPFDHGKDPADRCGALAQFVPLTVGGSFVNEVDAALSTIAAGLDFDPAILGAATPFKVATPQRGMRVIKRGRTSEDTESVVRDVDFRIQINYPDLGGLVGFTGQVRCDRYTEGGDSGSIVVDKDSGAIVGLHFAGSPTQSVFTPIKTVMNALGFTF